MKVGFLFNHDQIHQVAHSLPVAAAMQREYPNLEIVIITSSEALSREVARLSEVIGVTIPNIELELSRLSTKIASAALEWLVPVRKVGILRDNLDILKTFDILVVAEKTSLMLHTRYDLRDLKIVHTRHGAGDRAIGFNRQSGEFDHVLASGAKIKDRLVSETSLSEDSISVVGYPKFDLIQNSQGISKFSNNDNPIILYNPHPSPHLSSWYKSGKQILDFFLENQNYNLIFAPHVMLFQRKFVFSLDKLSFDMPGKLAQKYLDSPNILIDLGSSKSTDMTYTMAADIYLGDSSSQVYEFLYKPRPIIFFDSHKTQWHDNLNYRHWQMGEVIQSVSQLPNAIGNALNNPDKYAASQSLLFSQSFDLTHETSSSRAAKAIANLAIIKSKNGVEV